MAWDRHTSTRSVEGHIKLGTLEEFKLRGCMVVIGSWPE